MKQSMSLVHTTVVKVTIFSWQIFGTGLYCTMEGIVALHIALSGKSYKAKKNISSILNSNPLT